MAPAQTPAKNVDKNDASYRDQLISEYLPYVKRIVHRIAVHLPSTIDIDDLMNVGASKRKGRPDPLQRKVAQSRKLLDLRP